MLADIGGGDLLQAARDLGAPGAVLLGALYLRAEYKLGKVTDQLIEMLPKATVAMEGMKASIDSTAATILRELDRRAKDV